MKFLGGCLNVKEIIKIWFKILVIIYIFMYNNTY